jgi:hypothetical protein
MGQWAQVGVLCEEVAPGRASQGQEMLPTEQPLPTSWGSLAPGAREAGGRKTASWH